mmetsp:Transcript_42496/g.135003  ORF Transcript_42496/g.135003 Transcript_42496/m.135003 type:complete len:278 (+) Transcript_42496:278-1111(+)
MRAKPRCELRQPAPELRLGLRGGRLCSQPRGRPKFGGAPLPSLKQRLTGLQLGLPCAQLRLLCCEATLARVQPCGRGLHRPGDLLQRGLCRAHEGQDVRAGRAQLLAASCPGLLGCRGHQPRQLAACSCSCWRWPLPVGCGGRKRRLHAVAPASRHRPLLTAGRCGLHAAGATGTSRRPRWCAELRQLCNQGRCGARLSSGRVRWRCQAWWRRMRHGSSRCVGCSCPPLGPGVRLPHPRVICRRRCGGHRRRNHWLVRRWLRTRLELGQVCQQHLVV